MPPSQLWRTIISDLRVAAVLLVLAITVVGGCSDRSVAPSPSRPLDDAPPRRIVSLAPSITEVLFKLGLGDRVAGVTRYCDYPPEATEKPVVGGYFDVNYEMLLSLEPDLVVLLVEHQDALVRFEELGIRTLAVNHSRVDEILESITTIAERTGVAEKGKDLRLNLENRIRQVQENVTSASPRLRVPASDSSSPPARACRCRSSHGQGFRRGDLHIGARWVLR